MLLSYYIHTLITRNHFWLVYLSVVDKYTPMNNSFKACVNVARKLSHEIFHDDFVHRCFLILFVRDFSIGIESEKLPNMAYRAFIASFRIESDVKKPRKITSLDAERSIHYNNPNTLGRVKRRRLISIDNR